jgi:flagellar protein FliS
MVSHAYALSSYTQTMVQTSTDSLSLVIMLYDGAIEFLHKAGVAMEKRQLPVKLKYIDKTLAVIEELNNSLDTNIGGELAANLRALYQYMLKEIVLANAQNDREKLREMIQLLETLRSGFKVAGRVT